MKCTFWCSWQIKQKHTHPRGNLTWLDQVMLLPDLMKRPFGCIPSCFRWNLRSTWEYSPGERWMSGSRRFLRRWQEAPSTPLSSDGVSGVGGWGARLARGSWKILLWCYFPIKTLLRELFHKNLMHKKFKKPKSCFCLALIFYVLFGCFSKSNRCTVDILKISKMSNNRIIISYFWLEGLILVQLL